VVNERLPEGVDPREYPAAGKVVPCPSCVNVAGIPEQTFFERSRMDPKLRSCRLTTWQPVESRERRAAQEYVHTWPPEKPILLFFGPTGRGKSGMAAAILQRLWERHGKVGYFTTTIDLLRRYQATFNEDSRTETIETVRAVLSASPLIVLDDLGKESGTGFAQQEMYALINERYSKLAPLIATTNVAPGSLDPAVRSRLFATDIGTALNFSGPDRRAK
jgi:DNA replication protein DnaC